MNELLAKIQLTSCLVILLIVALAWVTGKDAYYWVKIIGMVAVVLSVFIIAILAFVRIWI